LRRAVPRFFLPAPPAIKMAFFWPAGPFSFEFRVSSKKIPIAGISRKA
jgi:hypothetical protein